jgi:hypothetical protein
MKTILNILAWLLIPYVKVYIILKEKNVNKVVRIGIPILIFCLWVGIIQNDKNGDTENKDKTYAVEPTQQIQTQTIKPTEIKTPEPTLNEIQKRDKWINSQILEDGSNSLVNLAIMNSLKNPKSFEHVDSKIDKNELSNLNLKNPKIYVTCIYRGTNSFNAIVTEKIKISIQYPNYELKMEQEG